MCFTPAGRDAYLKDLPKAEIHRLNAGHFATRDHRPFIAGRIVRSDDQLMKPAH